MQFGYTILYVSDVASSLDFYERALGQRRRFLHESGQYAELDTGETALAFAAHELAAANLPAYCALRGGSGWTDCHVLGRHVEYDEYWQGGYSHAGLMQGNTTADVGAFFKSRVAAAFDRAVEEGAASVSAPQTKPWGQDVAYIRDPDGNLVELASPV